MKKHFKIAVILLILLLLVVTALAAEERTSCQMGGMYVDQYQKSAAELVFKTC